MVETNAVMIILQLHVEWQVESRDMCTWLVDAGHIFVQLTNTDSLSSYPNYCFPVYVDEVRGPHFQKILGQT